MTVKIGIAAGGTGGHIMPAVHVARAIRDQGGQCLWLGDGKGMEARIAKIHEMPFYPIDVSMLVGLRMRQLPIKGIRMARTIFAARRCLQAFGVNVVFATGAYVSFPTAVAAKTLGIPLVLHEQNTHMGRANKLLLKMASKVCLGMPIEGLPQEWVVGNPTRMGGEADGDTLLIMGGSQGCAFFNTALPQIIKDMGITQPIIHLAGKDHDTVRQLYQSLGVEASVHAFVTDMASVYAKTQSVIARAGAMTLTELSAYGLPAILVPYPHAAGDHQRKNAQYFVDKNAALLAEESISSMTEALGQLAQKSEILAENIRLLHYPDALSQITGLIQYYHAHSLSD